MRHQTTTHTAELSDHWYYTIRRAEHERTTGQNHRFCTRTRRLLESVPLNSFPLIRSWTAHVILLPIVTLVHAGFGFRYCYISPLIENSVIWGRNTHEEWTFWPWRWKTATLSWNVGHQSSSDMERHLKTTETTIMYWSRISSISFTLAGEVRSHIIGYTKTFSYVTTTGH